jgi:hypothetical protein
MCDRDIVRRRGAGRDRRAVDEKARGVRVVLELELGAAELVAIDA